MCFYALLYDATEFIVTLRHDVLQLRRNNALQNYGFPDVLISGYDGLTRKRTTCNIILVTIRTSIRSTFFSGHPEH
jgi:hypothetical protein